MLPSETGRGSLVAPDTRDPSQRKSGLPDLRPSKTRPGQAGARMQVGLARLAPLLRRDPGKPGRAAHAVNPAPGRVRAPSSRSRACSGEVDIQYKRRTRSAPSPLAGEGWGCWRAHRQLRRIGRDPARCRADDLRRRSCRSVSSGSTPRRCSRKSCSNARSARRWRQAKPSSRGPGPTPGRWRGCRSRGSAPAQSCSPEQAGKRSPSVPARSSARLRPASPAPRSIPPTATLTSLFSARSCSATRSASPGVTDATSAFASPVPRSYGGMPPASTRRPMAAGWRWSPAGRSTRPGRVAALRRLRRHGGRNRGAPVTDDAPSPRQSAASVDRQPHSARAIAAARPALHRRAADRRWSRVELLDAEFGPMPFAEDRAARRGDRSRRRPARTFRLDLGHPIVPS